MLELIKTILVDTNNKFEFYSDNPHSNKVKRVIWFSFRNPDQLPDKAQWIYKKDVDISEFIKYEDQPLKKFQGNKDNDVENIKAHCKALCQSMNQ